MKFKKILLIVFAVIGFTNIVKADEGMWLPMLINKNYDQMKRQGFKLTAQDIYDINKGSLKDAIVWFGGFCTGEIVSDKGLILTNHHCGYDVIASKSTPQDNILDNGFWAKNHSEEKPAEGLFVSFLVRMEDVTAQVNAATKGLEGAEKAAKYAEVSKEIVAKATAGTGYEAFVRDMFKGNQYFVFVTEKYTDIRLVGTPPQSVGKFGGDTDNWVWPRHTGDFSMFRIYASKDNKPATYSKDNVPFTPKRSLAVSLKGVKEGDFSMVFGYPGRTNRYENSYGIKLAIEKVNPAIVKLRDIRLKSWKEQMEKSDSVRLLLSSDYANIANYWKYYIGQTEQLKHLKVYDFKKSEEAKFQSWAEGKADYSSILTDYGKAYQEYTPYALYPVYLAQGIFGPTAISYARSFMAVEAGLKAGKTDVTASMKDATEDYFKSFNIPSDKKILAGTLLAFYNDIPKDQHPALVGEILAKYGSADPEASFKKYSDDLYANTMFASKDKTEAFLATPDLAKLQNDPAYQYVSAFISNYRAKFMKNVDAFNATNAALGQKYVKGIMEMNPGKLMYPDANSTMRLTYGNVKAYAPKDAVKYDYVTTIDGVMEKYVPKDSEFDLPANYIELYNKKDFGQYANEKGQLIVGFISNNDITGGNSGSPVINGNGELIGLAFDGNWEAMSGDIVFDQKYKRTICADIRYVLWCIDKLGGAPHIVKEMKIVK
ncbi:S46 family peptidase [Solitalea sp. MAHUQ-68]|uniref:Dipeptidyl-peptidase n=1 Tax=Solitalea agri TaxID=2953739 RepID=A0A9X2F034_9SPHI|nr:S46 family peptidase [Solitalea agri]MCO4291635.1 S46 family peptidase [Solitalea agri]